jgi:hypothetical protein
MARVYVSEDAVQFRVHQQQISHFMDGTTQK